MTKLTPNQQLNYQALLTHGVLFVGFNSPNLIKTYDSLVDKGLATAEIITSYGKRYKVVRELND